MTKIMLIAENCWIRASRGDRRLYFQSHKQWNKSPAHATIFREIEAAEHEIWRARKMGLVDPAEILEAVPLHGALMTAGRGV